MLPQSLHRLIRPRLSQLLYHATPSLLVLPVVSGRKSAAARWFAECYSHDIRKLSRARRIENSTKRVVAIKIIDLEEAEDEIEDIQQEITVLAHVRSPVLPRPALTFMHELRFGTAYPSRRLVLDTWALQCFFAACHAHVLVCVAPPLGRVACGLVVGTAP